MTTPSSSFPSGDPSSVPPPGGQYGSMPAAHPTTHHPAPAKPKAVDTAFLALVVGGGIGVLQGLFALISSAGSAGSSVIAMLLCAGIVGVAFQMRTGLNWARITVTVLAGIVLLLLLIGLVTILQYLGLITAFGGPLVYVGILLAVVELVALAAGLVFMFRPESNTYFNG